MWYKHYDYVFISVNGSQWCYFYNFREELKYLHVSNAQCEHVGTISICLKLEGDQMTFVRFGGRLFIVELIKTWVTNRLSLQCSEIHEL